MDIRNAKLYVGTYAKYNAGSLNGEWLNLNDYANKEEFYKACRELHADETDPEFMFQDAENIPESLYGESYVNEFIWEILSRIDEISNVDAFFEFCEYMYPSPFETGDNIDDFISDFNDAYEGEYDNEEDFARYTVEECYNIEKTMGNLACYFDYEAFARDLFLTDYMMLGDYVFRRI